MSATKRVIGDQVLMRLFGGIPDSASPVQLSDVYKALEQKMNATFALRQFAVNLPNATTIPDNLSLATYENVTITSLNGGRSYSTLPVTPVSLPRNAGINEIRPVIESRGNNRLLGDPFIPMQAGQGYLLNADKLLSGLFGQVSYEPQNRKVVFSKDVTLQGVTKCDMKLVVFDMSQYDELTPLPIPADMEEMMVNELVKQFSDVLPESGIVNPYTTANQQQNK